MSYNMNMNMNMNMAGTSLITSRSAVVPELGERLLTLDFTPQGPNSPFPAFTLIDPVPTVYRSKLWNTSLRSLLYMPDFLIEPHPASGLEWNKLDNDNAFNEFLAWQANQAGSEAFLQQEVTTLSEYMQNYRERYLAEIVDQHDNFITPWLALLGVDRTQRWVLTLIQTALRIGELVVMFYKDKYKRPRPSHICPTLAPPFGPPGHPSFPSGHALQGHLVAHCLIMMTRVQTNNDPNNPIYDYPWEGQIRWLAKRIALNREYAGLHFPSDTAAGIWLAEQCFEILAETDRFQQLMNDAIKHWKGE